MIMGMYRVSVRYPHVKYRKKDTYFYYYVLATSEDEAVDKVRHEKYEGRGDLSEYKFYAWKCDDVELSHSEEKWF